MKGIVKSIMCNILCAIYALLYAGSFDFCAASLLPWNSEKHKMKEIIKSDYICVEVGMVPTP